MTPLPASDILENLETAVVVLDSNLLITALNPAAENLLGISRKRATAAPLLPLVDEDETLKRVLANSLATFGVLERLGKVTISAPGTGWAL